MSDADTLSISAMAVLETKIALYARLGSEAEDFARTDIVPALT